MARQRNVATVTPPKKIGKPKNIDEERERIEATRTASTIKVKMPDGSYEQVDNVKAPGAKPKEA